MAARLRTLTAAAAAALLVGALSATPAYADSPTTPGATAFSAAATTGTGSLQANLQLSGSLGGLLDVLVSPIVTGALNPLVSALQGGANTLASSLLGASSSLHADTPITQSGTAPATFPNDTPPSPCTATGALPCYQATTGPALNASPLVSVGMGLVQGWTQQVPNTYDPTMSIYGRAQALSTTVSALSGISTLTNPIVSVSTVDAKANCPNDGKAGASRPQTSPTALAQATGVTVLGGLVTLSVINGQVTNLVVNATSYPTLQSLGSTTLVSGVTVSSYGNAVLVSVPVAAADLIGALGLDSAVVTKLLGYGPASTVTLRIVIGPSAQPTVNTATAYGLGIGVDLSGALSFNLLGLVGATVNLPSGISSSNNGNLLDLRLATVTCQSGTGTIPANAAIPPELV